MARRKNEEPKITHTEIIALAIEQISGKMAPYKEKLEVADTDELRALIQNILDPLEVKLGLLLNLYRIETGNDYGIDLG
ncbi:hypothetical protein [uncultured Dysosmobacter sp.]|uniref:hypothetical protein n=1 Tax=uncultured Dysosmobacter sp. TaxID=2591384 RepID=UPI0026157A1F|nr:hypothetical protein [uncultured Dysosmobacter sp.]